MHEKTAHSWVSDCLAVNDSETAETKIDLAALPSMARIRRLASIRLDTKIHREGGEAVRVKERETASKRGGARGESDREDEGGQGLCRLSVTLEVNV